MHCMIAVSIAYEHDHCNFPGEVVTIIEGNRCKIGLAQTKDTDTVVEIKSGERIFYLFLQCISMLKNITISVPRTARDSTCINAAVLE